MALPGERGISGRPSGGDSHRSAQDMVRRLVSPAVRVEYVNDLMHMGGGADLPSYSATISLQLNCCRKKKKVASTPPMNNLPSVTVHLWVSSVLPL